MSVSLSRVCFAEKPLKDIDRLFSPSIWMAKDRAGNSPGLKAQSLSSTSLTRHSSYAAHRRSHLCKEAVVDSHVLVER
jgi:hypothetical protein